MFTLIILSIKTIFNYEKLNVSELAEDEIIVLHYILELLTRYT